MDITDIFLGNVHRYIKLQRYGMTTYVEGRTQGVRIKIVAIESNQMPKEVFVFQRRPSAPPGESIDVFTNIASPNDLEEYPVGDITDIAHPFLRLDVVDLVFRSPEHAQDGIQRMVGDIAQLVESLNFMDSLVLQEEITIGNPPTSSSSSNSSPSSSSAPSSIVSSSSP